MATQIKLRRDTYQNWYDANPVLAEGEPGYDLTNKKLKIGDGTTLWRVLPYFDDQITDLSSYAGSIVPSVDATYNLGSPSKRWNDAFLANNSVYIGDIKLSNNAGTLVVQQVTNAGLQSEASVINPGVVTTTSLTNGAHRFALTGDGTLTLDGQPFTAGAGGGDSKTWITSVSTGRQDSRIMTVSSVEYDSIGNILALALVANNEGGVYPGNSTNALIKLDPNGQLIWQYDLNDSSFSFETQGWGIAQDSVGNIYITGYYGDSSLMVVKLDSNAIPVWTKTYSGYTNLIGLVVDVGADDHPVIVGQVTLPQPQGIESLIVKLDGTDGTIMWAKSLGGLEDDMTGGMAVSRTDNSVVVVGTINRLGLQGITAFDYGPVASNPNWTQNVTNYSVGSGIELTVEFGEGIPTITIGGNNANQSVGTVFIIPGEDIGGATPADNLEVTVTAIDGNYDDHLMVAKYNSNGALQWQKALSIDLTFDVGGSDADIDSEGNVYVLGYGYWVGGAGIVLSKFNSSGQAQWTRTVQGDCTYVGGSIVVGDDDLLYISTTAGVEVSGPDGVTGGGFTQVNTYLAKYNKSGTVQWQRELSKTNWYVSTGVWMGPNLPSGSNLDVKNGYIVSGNSLVPNLNYAASQNDGWNNFLRTVVGQTEGMITQLPSTGEAIDIGSYSLSVSRLPGVLASPIVANAELTETTLVDLVDATTTFATTELNLEYGKVGPNSGSVTGDITFDGKVIYNQTGITLSTVRGSLNFGHDLEAPGQSTHFHVNGTETNNIHYFFGDDYNYLQLNAGYNGVTIGANNNDGSGQQLWSFGTDGTLTLPGSSDITVPAATESNRGGRDIRIQGVRGYGNWSTNNVTGYAGEGSSIKLSAGRGGESADQQGGEGGAIELRSGIGNGGGNGGTMYLYGGDAEWGATQTVSGGDVRIQAGNALSSVGDLGLGGSVDIKAGSGTLNNGRVRIRTNNGTSTWNFNNDGSLQMPNGYSLLAAQNTTVSAGSAPTVVYTSIDPYVGSIKATIKVYVRQADDINGDHDEDTQVCEMLIATKQRFIDNGGTWTKTAVGTVYGVTHTSTAPLATFTVNFVQGYVAGPGIPPKDVVQILAEPTAAVTGTNMWVMVAATEMTND